MANRKPFLLRIDPAVLEAVQHWAADDLRSLNGQIEFILRRALSERRRVESRHARSDRSPGRRGVDAAGENPGGESTE